MGHGPRPAWVQTLTHLCHTVTLTPAKPSHVPMTTRPLQSKWLIFSSQLHSQSFHYQKAGAGNYLPGSCHDCMQSRAWVPGPSLIVFKMDDDSKSVSVYFEWQNKPVSITGFILILSVGVL